MCIQLLLLKAQEANWASIFLFSVSRSQFFSTECTSMGALVCLSVLHKKIEIGFVII